MTVALQGASAVNVSQTVLTNSVLNAHDTFEKPHEVVPQSSKTALTGSQFVCTLPPASINRLDIRLT